MPATLLATGPPLLADGATGAKLFEIGLASAESPEVWNERRPERIRAPLRAFVEARADIVLTNGFGVARRRRSEGA